MINIKSKKGITLATLVITVIILLILSGTAIYNAGSTSDAGRYNNMVADIELLNDKILVYYNKYGEIPKTDRYWKLNIEGIGFVKYYEIDLSKLEGLTLNYGKDYGKEETLTETSDVYLINSSLHVYYLKGVEKNRETYHFVNNNENYIQEYTKLEYIESTGTQYIDTNIFPKNSTKIKFDFQFTDLSANNQQYNGASHGNGSYFFWGYYHINKNIVSYFNNEQSGLNFIAANTDRHTIFLENGNQQLDGIKYGTKEFDGNYNSSESMYLFACNFSYNNTVQCYSKEKVYSCQMFEGDKLVRDYIPCKDPSGVVCLYEKVEDKYYYNQGTGDFVAGPEV